MFIKKYAKRYFIDAMGAMALGLFASLLIATIFDTIGKYTDLAFLTEISTYAKAASGMAIGVAVARALGADPLVMFTMAAVGYMGYSFPTSFTSVATPLTAGPAGAYVAVLVASEVSRLLSKKTKVDILVTPTVGLLVGYGITRLACPGIAYVMYWLGQFVNTATEYQPLLMGIVISVVVGMILTLPISSAAICAMIGISGIAGGAATVGCCAQMVGFAVMSFRANGWGGIVSQGLGTSMLQMGNIVKKPQIWIAPTAAAAICGPLATIVFKLECNGVAAGMGTCGLVGPIGIFSATEHSARMWIGMVLLCLVLPAVFSWAIGVLLEKIGLYSQEDLRLPQ